jgi:glycosyltransferase involved in cell wall biosynthesis
LSKSELLETYQKSDILFFASTYEGFGLPIIEAQACGIPVITSNFGSMQEITENGQSAHLVDPTSVPEITAGIHKIVNDDVYRLRLIENGFVNSKRFSNDVIAMHYWELYQSMGKTGAQ